MAKRKPSRKTQKPAARGRRIPSGEIDQALAEAIQAFQSGQAAAAAKLCRQILRSHPDHPVALHLSGVIARQTGALNDAIEYLRRAVAAAPNYGEAYNDLGAACFDLGRFDEAGTAQEMAVQLAPGDIGPLMNLGNTRRAQGNGDAALACYREALSLEPRLAGAHVNIGVVLRDQGKFDAAVESQRQAIALDPNLVPAHVGLGKALRELDDIDGAAASFENALGLNPDNREALIGLGDIYLVTDRGAEAAACFHRITDAGADLAAAWARLGVSLYRKYDLTAAISALETAVNMNPDHAEAWFNLGNLRETTGDTEGATECYRAAIAARPAFAKAHNNLGFILNGLGYLDDAIGAYGAALGVDPNFADALNNMGNALRELGRLDEAIASYERALAAKPDFNIARSNILLTAHARPGTSATELLRLHREWDAHHAQPVRSEWPIHDNSRDPERRLKVGLISADFGRHPVGYFTIGFFENHDRAQFELTGYCNRPNDSITERFIDAAAHWVDTRTLSASELAERVRADGIDVLFDLSGHTTNHRLMTFARKPAPVQISWSGYPGTTGLAAMDYLVSDRVHTSVGDDADHAEKLLRMPASFICYTPPDDFPEVGPLPFRENGYVTFGCFSNPSKINGSLLDCWSRIMNARPGSRLVLTYQNLDAPENQQRIRDALRQRGIDSDRITFGGRQTPAELVAGYNGIDIALDTHPYSGGATTCEALWMGVPVVTTPGTTFASRHAASLLSGAGLTEWIADDGDALVNLALEMTASPDNLAEIRAGLRPRVATSPLCDAAAFSRDLGAAIREAWRSWCAE